MDQDKTCEKLTGEIITELRLPVKLYWPVIFQKFQMAYAVGFNEGRVNHHQCREIIQMDKFGKVLKTWKSIQSARRGLGTNHADIIGCLKGRRHTAGGYKWRYA